MAVKRKLSAVIPNDTKRKAPKVITGSDKGTKNAQKPSKRPIVTEADSFSDEEEFKGFDNDSDQMDEDKLDSEGESDWDSQEGESDDEDQDMEEVESIEDLKPSKPTNGSSSSVKPKDVPAHAAQRALAKERKLQKPNANKLLEAKKIWESLRLQKQTKSARQTQVDQLFALIQGDIPSLVFGHSASRFVQAAMKYGTSEQRMAIAKELKGRYIELAKAKYGKFLVGKILEYGFVPVVDCSDMRNADVRNLVVKEFIGNVTKLISHKEAGMVVNDVYRDICTPNQRLEFLQELYGPEFRLFKSDKGLSLNEILTEKPEKKEMISKNLIEMVKSCMKKDIINLDLVHTALLQALQISSSKDVEELVSLFKDQIQQLVHTKDGAYAACLIVSYGTAKDRKAMAKCIREIIPQMATDQFGHTVLIVMCAVVDDTKLISKSVLMELKSAWQDLIRDKWGRKFVLSLCREDNDPLLKECREKSVDTSKKDTQIRRQELLEFVSEDLLGIVFREADTLMRDSLAIQVAQEILLNARGDKSDAKKAVISLVSGDPSQDGHIMKLPFTARVYKTLVQGGHYNLKEKNIDVVDSSLNFADALYERIRPDIVQWAAGEGSFVVVGLLEALSGKGKEELNSQLKRSQKILKSHIGKNKGTKIVLEKIA